MTTAPVSLAPRRPGLDVGMGGPPPVVSPEWTIAGWSVGFVRLGPHATFCVRPGRPFHAKVVTGRLAAPDRGAYPAVGEVRSTAVTDSAVAAGPEGAVVALIFEPPGGPAPIGSIDELRWHGPLDDALAWQTFESKYTAATSWFDGLDAHLSPGFHLLDEHGDEIAYVFVWAAGPGVDLSTHDHGRAPGPNSPAFAEVHWVLANGTGRGGMYETPAPGSPVRHRTPLQAGEEHGPFFAFDAETGVPKRRENGAVDYPWHGWEAGTDDGPGRRYDVVMAFEITAPHARVTRP